MTSMLTLLIVVAVSERIRPNAFDGNKHKEGSIYVSLAELRLDDNLR